MAENSKIEWTDHTFNPWIGCQKVSPGCDHCYAEALMDTRWGKVQWGPHGERKRTSEANWKQPLRWIAKERPLGIARPTAVATELRLAGNMRTFSTTPQATFVGCNVEERISDMTKAEQKVLKAARAWTTERVPQDQSEKHLFAAVFRAYPEDASVRENCTCDHKDECEECPTAEQVESMIEACEAA